VCPVFAHPKWSPRLLQFPAAYLLGQYLLLQRNCKIALHDKYLSVRGFTALFGGKAGSAETASATVTQLSYDQTGLHQVNSFAEYVPPRKHRVPSACHRFVIKSPLWSRSQWNFTNPDIKVQRRGTGPRNCCWQHVSIRGRLAMSRIRWHCCETLARCDQNMTGHDIIRLLGYGLQTQHGAKRTVRVRPRKGNWGQYLKPRWAEVQGTMNNARKAPSSVFCTKYYYGEKIRRDEMARECSSHRRDEKWVQKFSRKKHSSYGWQCYNCSEKIMNSAVIFALKDISWLWFSQNEINFSLPCIPKISRGGHDGTS
jgi:hypothetical protein